MPISSQVTRRRWVMAAGAPLLVPRTVFGAAAPSNRVTVGMIGLGRQAMLVNWKQFQKMPDVAVVAVCDVDRWRLEQAAEEIKGSKPYHDFRELLADKSIDAVMISTPDHWHVPMSMEAIKAGKDVSCEKPLTRTIAEGRQLADLVRKQKRVFRTDSEFRSLDVFHRAVELVRNGFVGKLRAIKSSVPQGDVGCPPQPDMPVPEGLDYERWQGPAPRAPYTENRVHTPRNIRARPGWMRHLFYCDGMITNWGAHLNDIAQWGNNSDRGGPVEVEGRGEYPAPDSFWNVLLNFEVQYKFGNGVTMTYGTGAPYTRFEGDEGWIHAEYGKPLRAEPASILSAKIPEKGVHFAQKTDKQDFIDAAKTRGQTLQDAEVGHRTTSLCHLGHIAIQMGKKLNWDPVRERFTDAAANRYIDRPIHQPRRA